MISTAKAQNELNTLKDSVIGLFKRGDKFHLVMDYQEVNETVDLLTVTQLGILQKEFNSPTYLGVLHLFPDNKNMNDMLNEVYLFNGFLNKFL